MERKLITDVVRMAAYNAQSWLADRLARHYTNTNDVHDLLRSFAQLLAAPLAVDETAGFGSAV